MATSRPFSYNPTSIATGVSASFGSLSIGYQTQSYGNSPGGLKWYNGPDEDLGYVIGKDLPSGGPTAPDGTTSNVAFWRSNGFNEVDVVNFANKVSGQSFTVKSDAVTWLNSNGYYISKNSSGIYFGGAFTTYQSNTYNRLVKTAMDGYYNSSFALGTGFNNTVMAIAVQSDGKVLVGGYFTTYQGSSANYIIRLNTDGSIDNTFNIGTGFGSTVFAIKIQTDGKILVGGAFSTYKGTAYNKLVRLNTDGSYDTSFVLGTGISTGAAVYTLELQSNGKILVGGDFTAYQGTTRNYFFRLNEDGSYDTSFTLGTGFNNQVRTISVQSDGNILIGGYFTTYQGTTYNRLVRLDNSGSYDTTFSLGTGFGNTVFCTAIQTNGKILVGGMFPTYQGTSRNFIARLNQDGSYDTTFSIGTGFAGADVKAIYVKDDGSMFIGGNFTTYQGVTESYLCKLDSSGSLDASFNPGLDTSVQVISTA